MVLSYSKMNLLEHKTPKCIASQKKKFERIQWQRIRDFVVEVDLIIARKAIEFEG